MNNNENNNCNFFYNDTDKLGNVWDQKIDSDLWKEKKKPFIEKYIIIL